MPGSSQIKIDIEPSFDKVFARLGGQRVDEILGKGANFPNADYVISRVPVIAELKCLEKDQLPEFPKKLKQHIERWRKQGKFPSLPGNARVRIETGNLPDEMQKEIASHYRQPIHNVIKKADRQLGETKRRLALEAAPGLLILVNNGNRMLELNAAQYAIASALEPPDGLVLYPHVQRLLYMTANLTSELAGLDKDVLLWLDCHIRQSCPGLNTFMKELQVEWHREHEALLGEKIAVIRDLDRSPESMNRIKLIK